MTLALTFMPRAALTTHPTAALATPALPPVAQPVPYMLLASAVDVSPMVHPHLMRTCGAAGFWQSKLYIAASLSLSPVPKSVWATLVDPHGRGAM
jgi:hypothetical protein